VEEHFWQHVLVAFSEISRLARNVALGVPQEVFLLFREIPNPTIQLKYGVFNS
jgi:hypothetical protein